MYKPWQLAAMDEAGYNGIREEHLEKMEQAIVDTGLHEIDQDTFDRCCNRCGIDPRNFKQEDLDRLQDRLNRR